MRNLTLFSLFLLLLTACGPDKHHGRIEGKLEGINQATIQAFVDDSLSGDKGHLDTITVKRGKFSYDREISGPVILTLLYPNFSMTNVVVSPGQTVKIKGDASRLKELEIDGNEDNLLLTEFRKHSAKLSENEMKREAATFIRSHSKTLAAVSLFREVFANAEQIEQNPTASLLAELEKAQKDNPIVKSLSARLKPILKTAIGEKLPAFTATAFDGTTINSSSYAGKPLLIVFFAQWDGNFYLMKRYSRELQRAVGAGNMNMLFVSLDAEKTLLQNSLGTEGLPGKLAYDGKAFQSPLVKTLGIRYVPGNLLIDGNGTIIARDIPTDTWQNKIPSLLN